ncbi:hypothetical protein INS49_002421 [Diaporthe citri]|uniref:uncharacterized protein n=1 Tax=Diaporthe citri TaxID=83186 RepID=UPI001C7ECAB9|nr:uncharacterized protein INS49_002421 [Diaporthe citri]KAG6368220.1 hypothetical protein INS49_002421 [Diaporthe citri]
MAADNEKARKEPKTGAWADPKVENRTQGWNDGDNKPTTSARPEELASTEEAEKLASNNKAAAKVAPKESIGDPVSSSIFDSHQLLRAGQTQNNSAPHGQQRFSLSHETMIYMERMRSTLEEFMKTMFKSDFESSDLRAINTKAFKGRCFAAIERQSVAVSSYQAFLQLPPRHPLTDFFFYINITAMMSANGGDDHVQAEHQPIGQMRMLKMVNLSACDLARRNLQRTIDRCIEDVPNLRNWINDHRIRVGSASQELSDALEDGGREVCQQRLDAVKEFERDRGTAFERYFHLKQTRTNAEAELAELDRTTIGRAAWRRDRGSLAIRLRGGEYARGLRLETEAIEPPTSQPEQTATEDVDAISTEGVSEDGGFVPPEPEPKSEPEGDKDEVVPARELDMETLMRLEDMRGDDQVVVPTREAVPSLLTNVGVATPPMGSCSPYGRGVVTYQWTGANDYASFGEIPIEALAGMDRLTDKSLDSVFTTWKLEIRDDAQGRRSAWAAPVVSKTLADLYEERLHDAARERGLLADDQSGATDGSDSDDPADTVRLISAPRSQVAILLPVGRVLEFFKRFKRVSDH